MLIKVRDPEAEDDEEAEERPKAIPKKTPDQKPVNRKLVDHSRPEVNVVEQLVEEVLLKLNNYIVKYWVNVHSSSD